VGENELVVWRQNLLQQLLEKHIVFGDQQLHVLLLSLARDFSRHLNLYRGPLKPEDSTSSASANGAGKRRRSNWLIVSFDMVIVD
jgi:hypothetical protein